MAIIQSRSRVGPGIPMQPYVSFSGKSAEVTVVWTDQANEADTWAIQSAASTTWTDQTPDSSTWTDQ